jgi:signal transduction histidine kinase
MLAAANSAPWDTLWAVLASIVFVLVITVPAAILNARDHRRHPSQD